jgi:hypothetical protein
LVFAAALVAAVRVDDEEDPAQADPAQAGGEGEEANKNDTACAKLLAKTGKKGGNPQAAARAAAGAAHAAGLSPHEVVKAAAKAAFDADPNRGRDPEKAVEEAKIAAERALALPAEAAAVAEEIGKAAAIRRGRSVAELAAADVAKAAEDQMVKTGEGLEAAAAAHMKAMEYERSYGTGQGYMYRDWDATEPEQPKVVAEALTHGMTAMWHAFRAGESADAVVRVALEATKIAHGSESDIENIVAIASDPETFVSVKSFEKATEVGEAAAREADAKGWPLEHVAMAAGRAAADAEKRNHQNPGATGGPEEILLAAKEAASFVLDKQHQTSERVAREAAAQAKLEAKEYGHPDAQVQILTARAAAMAAGKHGAKTADIKDFVEAARKSAPVDNSGYDTQQWNGRVYAELDKEKAHKQALMHNVMGEDYVEPVKYGKVDLRAEEGEFGAVLAGVGAR